LGKGVLSDCAIFEIEKRSSFENSIMKINMFCYGGCYLLLLAAVFVFFCGLFFSSFVFVTLSFFLIKVRVFSVNYLSVHMSLIVVMRYVEFNGVKSFLDKGVLVKERKDLRIDVGFSEGDELLLVGKLSSLDFYFSRSRIPLIMRFVFGAGLAQRI
jgi:hypothetical protein